MPPLNNQRHERFVQALFKGKPASTAYAEAGYSPHDGNCIRLRGNERVQARLSELQAEAAKSAEVTVASLLGELEDARSPRYLTQSTGCRGQKYQRESQD